MDKKFQESGRLSNLCTQIGLFSLKTKKSSAELGRVGSSVILYPDNTLTSVRRRQWDGEVGTYVGRVKRVGETSGLRYWTDVASVWSGGRWPEGNATTSNSCRRSYVGPTTSGGGGRFLFKLILFIILYLFKGLKLNGPYARFYDDTCMIILISVLFFFFSTFFHSPEGTQILRNLGDVPL